MPCQAWKSCRGGGGGAGWLFFPQKKKKSLVSLKKQDKKKEPKGSVWIPSHMSLLFGKGMNRRMYTFTCIWCYSFNYRYLVDHCIGHPWPRHHPVRCTHHQLRSVRPSWSWRHSGRWTPLLWSFYAKSPKLDPTKSNYNYHCQYLSCDTIVISNFTMGNYCHHHVIITHIVMQMVMPWPLLSPSTTFLPLSSTLLTSPSLAGASFIKL